MKQPVRSDDKTWPLTPIDRDNENQNDNQKQNQEAVRQTAVPVRLGHRHQHSKPESGQLAAIQLHALPVHLQGKRLHVHRVSSARTESQGHRQAEQHLLQGRESRLASGPQVQMVEGTATLLAGTPHGTHVGRIQELHP